MRKSFQKLTVLTVMTLMISVFFAASAFAEIEFKGKVGVVINNMACFRGMDTMPTTDFQGVTIAGIDMKGAGPGVFTLGILGKYGNNLGGDKGLKNKRNDVTLAYTLPLLDKKLSLTVGNVSYLFSSSTVENINEAFISAKFNTMLNPTFTAYYDYDTDRNGLFMTAQISKGFKIAKSLKLGLSALASYNDESTVKISAAKSYSGFHNAEAAASLTWSATKQLKIIPNILFSTPISDDAEEIANLDDEFRFGLKMLVKF